VTAAAVIGDVRDVSGFPSRDHFASYDGTAPVEVSSGGRKIYRLSRRGNRRINHAIHMAAVTQIRCRHSKGRACYDKKIAEGKTPKEALRALKRQVSDAIYAALLAGAARAAARPEPGEPGRATGERLSRQRGRLTPPVPALRVSHSRTHHQPTAPPATQADPALALSRTAANPSSRAGGVQDRAQPGRAAASAGRP
jgi:transposase